MTPASHSVCAEPADQRLLYADSVSEAMPDTAFFLAKSVYLAESGKQSASYARAGLILGKLMFYQGHYTAASEYLVSASHVFEELQLHRFTAEALIWQGAVHQYTKQYALALHHYRESLELYRRLGQTGGIANAYSWIGHYYEKIRRYDSAVIYQNKARQLYLQIAAPQGLAQVYDNLGSIYEDLEMYDSAYRYFSKASDINFKYGNISRMVLNINDMGDVHRKRGNYALAHRYTDSAFALAKRHDLAIEEKYALRDKAKTFALQGRYDSAYVFEEASYDRHKALMNDRMMQRIAQLNTLYGSHRQQVRIAELEKFAMAHRWRILSLVIATALAIVVGLLYLARLRSQKSKGLFADAISTHPQSDLKHQLEKAQGRIEELQDQLTLKDQSLSAYLLQEINRNNVLENVKSHLALLLKADKNERRQEVQRLIQMINAHKNEEDKWAAFQQIFDNVHSQYFDKLKSRFPELSPGDLKLAALLKLNLNTSDIASSLNISADSLRVSRYRLRKKLQLEKGDNLVSFLMEY
jgi:tetratricopeptide (TPR) repeat protein